MEETKETKVGAAGAKLTADRFQTLEEGSQA
jgi:hypothetical protein